MEQPTDRQRRNSMERYQPKSRSNNEHENELAEKFGKTSLNDDSNEEKSNDSHYRGNPNPNRNRRRGVNSHLYGKSNASANNKSDRSQGHSSDYNNHRQNGWGHQSNERVNFQSNTAEQKPYQPKQRQNWNERDATPRKKNTETFKPSHKPTEMRIVSSLPGWRKYSREVTSRDVVVVSDLFGSSDDLSIYNKLLSEIESSGLEKSDLWQLWHGDSHVIADDKKNWKEMCPTFHMAMNKIRDYFDMDIKATRLNWYRDSTEWKPFHHDAAAIKPDKARTQNFTVAVSFGAERDAAFEHATTKTVISMPQPNGTIYCFAKDVNVIWRHGILQWIDEEVNSFWNSVNTIGNMAPLFWCCSMCKRGLICIRAMRGLVNNCDCVIEIRDARVPLSSSNLQFEDLYANKPRIILMNKIDMADEEKTKNIAKTLVQDESAESILYSNCKSTKNQALRKIMPILKDIFIKNNEEKSRKTEKPVKDLHEGTYRVLVCGIPNVGKSSFINSARRRFMSRGGKATAVGKKPGVTRSVLQSILISRSPRILILDTPGISAPEVKNPITGMKLALTGTFPDHVIGEEVIASYLLHILNEQNNTSYLQMSGLARPTYDFDEAIEAIAAKHNLYGRGTVPDYRRCSMLLIAAFRNGEFGRLTLDSE